ncbi:MAG: LPS assembly protein LptD [Deltaproteobacteria bacterium]|nr:LPS assembly protein LptD [Deltaproteobacteria bacterium]MBW2135028.1 LPS assembly protein LptD [Deltaproteobacteria bacterium]
MTRVICVLGAVLILLTVCPVWGQEIELFQAEQFEGGPWTIKADQITYDADTQTYDAHGRVEILQGNRRITADHIRVNETTKIASVRGHVVMVLEDDIFTGRVGNFNLATRCGEMQDARLFLKQNHFHVDSALIRKTGDSTYHAERCVVTTCDADRPVWSFYVRELDVVMEGYAIGKFTRLQVGPLPLMFLPVVAIPVKTTRQSGFLMPQYGQHQAGGTVVEMPLYWAINNYMDATFYQTLISSRGYMQGGEYRYAASQNSGGTLRLAYLRDGKEEAPTPHRYWVSGMSNQHLPGDWQAKLTLDRVSDARYLEDFNFGYLGLNRYNNILKKDYGRDLEQEDVNTRVSSLLLTRNFSLVNLTAFSRYYQRLLTSYPMPFHKVPALSVNTLNIPLGNWPVLLGLNTLYTYYYQTHGLAGHRLDLHPQLIWPVRLFGALDLKTQFGLRETAYRVEKRGEYQQLDDYSGRQLYDLKVSMSTSLCRDYGRNSGSTSFWRHILRPEVTYWSLPDYTTDRYPPFDPIDLGWRDQTDRNLPILEGDEPFGGVNAVTYSLSNSFLRRSVTPQGLSQVKELFWLRLSHSCFFNSAHYGLDGIPQPHHRFSDLLTEFECYPLDNFSLGLDLGTSPYKEGLNRVNLRMAYHDQPRQNYLNVDYLYLKDYAQQINTVAYLNLFRSIKTWISHQHTFVSENRLETKYGVIFQRQCWGLSLHFTDRPDDKRIGFMIFIPGWGERMVSSPVRQ